VIEILEDLPELTQAGTALAASLVTGVPDSPEQQAALLMLLQQGEEIWACPDVRMHYHALPWRQVPALRVDWYHLAFGTAHLNTLSADVRAALQVASSLADPQVLCHLGGCLAVMSPENRTRFVAMMASAAEGARA
jgi:hypothetical protein